MARLFAQVCALVFLVVGVGGLAAGSAGPPAANGGGNIGSLVLHLTWARDVLDIGLLVVFAYVGFATISNDPFVNWAVAGSRSTSGGALMAGDPHLHLTLPAI